MIEGEYLQKHLNLQKTKDRFGNSYQWMKAILIMSMKQPKAMETFKNNENDYQEIFLPTQLSS